MADLWHGITQWLDHNRGIAFAWVLAALLAGWLVGCNVTTPSLLDDGRDVTAHQFAAEVRHVEASLQQRSAMIDAQVVAYNADVTRLHEQIEAGLADLQAKIEFRKAAVQTLGGFATEALAGTFNPLSALGTLVSLLSMGTAVGIGLDNVRKNRVIDQLKTATRPAAGTSAGATPNSPAIPPAIQPATPPAMHPSSVATSPTTASPAAS